MTNEEREFINRFADAIARDSEIKMEDDFHNYDEWCSIAYISTIAMAYEYYNKELEDNDLRRLKTVQELCNFCLK